MRSLLLYIIITCLMLTTTACGKKVHSSEPFITKTQPKPNHIQTVMEADTKEEIKEVKTDKQIITPQSNTPASSHSSIECEYDNKRGFDPASKDDLDDIGLSYYMENNNEESWNYTQELNVLRALI